MYQHHLTFFTIILEQYRPFLFSQGQGQSAQRHFFSRFLQTEERFQSEVQLNSFVAGNPQVYLEHSPISTMELFCKSSGF